MIYYNPKSNEKKGEILLIKQYQATIDESKKNGFKLLTQDKNWAFDSIEYPAQDWVDIINKEIAHLA